MSKAYEFDEVLVRSLVNGSGYGKDSVMRKADTKWVALAEDATLLDWYSDGIPDGPLEQKLAGAYDALRELGNVPAAGQTMASLKQDAEKKEWRRGLGDMPADKLKKLDAEELAKIDASMKDVKMRIKDTLARAAKAAKTMK